MNDFTKNIAQALFNQAIVATSELRHGAGMLAIDIDLLSIKMHYV